jgi:hypothetical protein
MTVLLCGNVVGEMEKASRDWKSSKAKMFQEPEK